MSDLVTLTDVKHYLAITSDITDEDATLAALTSHVSQTVCQLLGRDLLTASYTHTFDGNGLNKIFLPAYPITAVASVTVDGDSIAARTVVTSCAAAYVFNSFAVTLIACLFTPGIQNCAITYTAGYATVPPSIQESCLRWIAYLYEKNDRIDLASKAFGTETTAYLTASMPADVRLALSQWRKTSFQ